MKQFFSRFLNAKENIRENQGYKIGLIFCLILVLCIAFVLFYRPQASSRLQDDLVEYAVISDARSEKTLLYAGKTPLAEVQGELQKRSVAFGGKWDVVLTGRGELYLLNEKKAVHLSSATVDFCTSAQGGAVAFLTRDGEVRLYDGGEQTKLLTYSYPAEDLSYFALSPTGKRAVYAERAEDGKYTLCVYASEKTWTVEELGHADFRPIAVSDLGEHLYYLVNEDSALYHLDQAGNLQKITASLSTEVLPVRFNRALDQVVFCEGNGCTYYSENACAKEKISSGAASPLLLKGEATLRPGEHTPCEFLSSLDFCSRLYLVRRDDAQNLRYLKEDFTTEKYAADVHSAHLSSDGKDLYLVRFTDGRYRVYYMDMTASALSETLVASGVTEYAFSTDGKNIYYITRGNKLYCRSENESIQIAEGATGVSVSPRDEVFFEIAGENETFVLYVLQDEEPVALYGRVKDYFFTADTTYLNIRISDSDRWSVLSGTEAVTLKHPDQNAQ